MWWAPSAPTTSSPSPTTATGASARYNWCHDNRTILYMQDQGGDENWRIYSVNTDGGPVVDLTPFEGVQAQLLALSKERPDQVVIGINKDNPQLHDVYVLTLSTGDLEKVAENPGFVHWADRPPARGARRRRPAARRRLRLPHRRQAGARRSTWRTALSTDIVGFTKDGTGLYVKTSVGANAARLFVLDLASGEQTVIAEDPTVRRRHRRAASRRHARCRLVGFVEDRLEYQVLDPSIQADIDALQRLHHGDLVLQGRDHADRTWLVAFTADDGPVPYYAWDRETQEAHVPVRPPAGADRLRAGADGAVLVHGPRRPDGARLPDLPGRRRAGEPAGGAHRPRRPVGPRQWGFNPEAQWLANRGYVCRPGQLPRLDRLRQGVRQRRRQASGAARCTTTCSTPSSWVVGQGCADREAGRHLRRLLRRLRGAGRRDLHARRVLLRRRHRRPVEPEDPDRSRSRRTGSRSSAQFHDAGRQPRDRGGVPAGRARRCPGSTRSRSRC